MNKEEILDYYNSLCKDHNKKLSRAEYRNITPKYSSSLIEKIWGSWTNFVNKTKDVFLINRVKLVKHTNNRKVVISYVQDGSEINIECFNTLKNYCDKNKAELFILWGKNIRGNKLFNNDTYTLLQPYLTTSIIFDKDSKCVAEDFLIPSTQKNPLVNLDKLTTDLTTVVVGSCKQYMRILPYKQYSDYRIAYSTGTISVCEYKETVSGNLDKKNHTFGAILLDYNNDKKRYVPRNLIYKYGFIHDLNKKYDQTKEYTEDVSGMVLGDLHLPDEDSIALGETLQSINEYKPKQVVIHDIASWNSISHHEFNLPFTRAKNRSYLNRDLRTELTVVLDRMDMISKLCPNTTFCIVNSNHDEFIRKWLEKDFIKDTSNAKFGAELFIKYLDGKTILSDNLPKNFIQLKPNQSYKIEDFEVNEHGDCGISGAHGSVNSFNKGFDKVIYGHTHSPEIYEKVVIVGTLSKLKLSYNQQGLTKWVHSNALIHKNGTYQLILL